MKLGFGIVLLFASSIAYASDNVEVARTENWIIKRSLDSMTDKKECLAYYQENRKIQFDEESLAVGGLEWPKGFRYRLDDNSPSDMKLTDDLDKKMGAIFIMGKKNIAGLVNSNRLRIRVTASKTVEYDINTSDLKQVVGYLRSDLCK